MGLVWRLRRLAASVWAELILWSLWSLVVLFSIGLPIYLGSNYLAATGCHPHLDMRLAGGSISAFTTPASLSYEDLPYPPPEEDDFIVKSLATIFPPEPVLRLGNSSFQVRRLPRLLFRQGANLGYQLLEAYSLPDLASLCRVNSRSGKGILSLGLAVCGEALDGVAVGLSGQLAAWLAGLAPGVEEKVVTAFLKRDLLAGIRLLPALFPRAGLNENHTESLANIIRPFSTAELLRLAEAALKANINEKDFLVLNAVLSDPKTNVSEVYRVLGKIKPESLPAIAQKLGQLGLQLSDFIVNPGVFFAFLDDPTKSALLVELQGLLPRFLATDIEAFLVFSKKIDEAQAQVGEPGAEKVMAKIFKIPIDILVGALGKLELGKNQQGLDGLKLLMNDADAKKLLSMVSDVKPLMESSTQEAVITNCTRQGVHIQCHDHNNDLCENGQILLGVATLAPLLVPGILYSITSFLHYKGDVLQCGVGKPLELPLPRVVWIILLPIYIIIMVPWTLLLIIYRQVMVVVGLGREATGQNFRLEPDSKLVNMATNFGLLLGAGQGILYLGVEAVILGVVLLAGDVIFGINREEFRDSTLIITLVSMALLCIVMGVSHLSGQEGRRLSVDLSTPARPSLYLLSSLAWLGALALVSVASTLILAILVFVDTVGFTEWRWSGVSLLVLLPLPFIQAFIYQLSLKSAADQRFALGFLASTVPVPFLEREKRRCRWFLVLSQGCWFLLHFTAWILYAAFVHSVESSDVVWRVWIPVVVPVLALPPLLAFLHWSLYAAHLYSATHAHPDMQRLENRLRSFPPEWEAISRSLSPSSSLAKAGFFFSCRRLKFSEATCFSCGRQVTEWEGRTAEDVHRQFADSCPLYARDSSDSQLSSDMEVEWPSLLAASHLIISLVCRLLSVALLIWVFWEAFVSMSAFIPTLWILPVLFLLISLILNAGLYSSYFGEQQNPFWAFASCLAPRPMPLVMTRPALRYLFVNNDVNMGLHAALWVAMFATADGVAALCWQRLLAIWPVLLTIGLLTLVSPAPTWLLLHHTTRQKHQVNRPSGTSKHKTDGHMVSTPL